VVDNAVNPRMTSLWSAAAHRCGAVRPRHAPDHHEHAHP